MRIIVVYQLAGQVGPRRAYLVQEIWSQDVIPWLNDVYVTVFLTMRLGFMKPRQVPRRSVEARRLYAKLKNLTVRPLTCS